MDDHTEQVQFQIATQVAVQQLTAGLDALRGQVAELAKRVDKLTDNAPSGDVKHDLDRVRDDIDDLRSRIRHLENK